MKFNSFYIISLELINIVFSIVPLWNFENSSEDLLSSSESHEYTIIDQSSHYYVHYTLKKSINKDNLILNNTFTIDTNGGNIRNLYNVEWEDIESAYVLSNFYYICPKGRFHPYYINIQNGEFSKLLDFEYEGDWELKCYFQPDSYFLFISYLNAKIDLFQIDINNQKILYQHNFEDGIFDFKWQTSNNPIMFPLVLKDQNIDIKKITFNSISNNGFSYNIDSSKNIVENLQSNYKAFFNSKNSNFYWINYNNNNKEFKSGYCNNIENLYYSDINNIQIKNNENSPLEFLDKVTIKQMQFIPYTRFVYYEIFNENEKTTYHGIIDITLNKVVFNTNVKINKFIPYSDNSMLAITDKSAYKICIMKNANNNNCIDPLSCGNGYYPVYNAGELNQCKSNTECDNYNLYPNNICIDSCNQSIYTIKDKNCGLCRDLGENDNKYKLINTEGCTIKDLEGTKVINEELQLLDCLDNYQLMDGKCVLINCHKLCNGCYNTSNDDKNQLCKTCKYENYYLYNGNCNEECPIGTFKSNNNKCENCDDNCKTCDKNSTECKSCNIGFYLNEKEQKCNNCSLNCKECSKGEEGDNENCISCNKDSNYPYLIKAKGYFSNCVNKCPNNTILKDNECIIEEKDEESFILYIYIILIAILLIIVLLYFYIKECSKGKKSDENLISDINTELIENKGLVQ